jgi:hypothetical protein
MGMPFCCGKHQTTPMSPSTANSLGDALQF